uniref:Polyprotein n=1 Tax=Warroolaba Creek virus 3 TaxID=2714908 RepID=A0A6G7M5K3_9VIRU|nr:hypothetical protein [Warroolaba Creek virus 3]
MSLPTTQTDVKVDPPALDPDNLRSDILNAIKSMPAKDTMQFVQMLTDLLDGLLSKEVKDTLTYTVCSSLVASLLGFITSAVAMFNSTAVGGVIHGAVLLTQLNAFVANLHVVLKASNITFSKERALEAVQVSIQSAIDKLTPNSFEWLATLFQQAMLVMIAGLTTFKVVDIKHVLETGAMIKANETITKSISGFTKFVLQDLCHLDITGEAAYFKEVTDYAERSIFLAATPYHEYITKPELYQELENMLTNVIPVVSKRVTPKTSASLRSACTILVNHVSVLNNKLASIREALTAQLRQETVGIYLCGKQAVGKSSLITYVWNKIAEEMGYSKDQYNLSLNNDSAHFAPYAMQHVGIYNEFGFYRDQDPILPKLTGIISGDPFNMPGAALEHKVQPANFKAVFLTSNVLSPNLTGACSQQGVEALWDRFLRFEIIDPKNPSRNQTCPWRQPDFSHLTVRLYRTNDSSLVLPESSMEVMTVEQMIKEIKAQLIARELNYLKTRAAALHPADYIENRIRQLELTPNAGRTFFVVRYQGPPSAGKTADASVLATLFNQAYRLPIRYVYSFDELPIKAPAIYVVDDILPQQEHKSYLAWINRTHERSVVLLVTNTILEPKGIWKKVVHIDSDAPSGIARRLGISHPTLYKGPDGKIHNLAMPYQYTVNKTSSGLATCGDITNGDINNYLLKEYNNYLISMGGIVKTQLPYTGPLDDWDFHGVFKTVDEMHSCLSSKTAATAAYAKGRIAISPRLANFAQTMEKPIELLSAVNVTTAEHMEHNATVLASFFERRIPGVRMYFTIGDKTFVVDGRTLHLPCNTDISVKATPDEFIITNIASTVVVPRSVALKNYFSEQPMLLSELQDDVSSYLALNHYIANHEDRQNWHAWFSLNKLRESIQSYKEKGALSFAMNNKVVTIIAAIGVAVTTCVTAKRLWNWAFTKELKQNTSGDEDNPDDPRYKPLQDLRERYQRAVFNRGNPSLIKQEAAEKGMGKLFGEWEIAFRSNARNVQDVVNLLQNTPIEHAVRHLRENPKSLRSLVEYCRSEYHVPNMVSIDDIITPIPSLTKAMAAKLIKNYARIDAKGSCYALGLRDKLFVTVSHLFGAVNETCQIRYNGEAYNARCIKLNRPRDLAIVMVTDKHFPTLTNIESMLPSISEHTTTTSATFVRPLPNELSYHTDTVRYIPKSIITRTCSDRFALNENFYIMDITTMCASQQVYQRGDCGFPIVVYKDNKWLIMGIHNSYHQADGTMYFSALHKEDLNDLRTNVTPNSDMTIGHPLDEDTAYTTTSFMRSKLDVEMKPSVFQDVSDLPFFGFNPNFAPTSRPSHKKQYLAACEEVTECPVLPSALDLTHVTDTSSLVKNTHGTPHPLLTQAVKYAKKTPEYGRGLDPQITELTLDHINTYFQTNYNVESTPLKLGAIINGFGALQGFDMTTSVGMNLKMQYKIHVKRPEDNPDVLFVNRNKEGEKPYYAINIDTPAGRQLNEDFNLYDKSIQNGIPICMIIKDNAKVELLPKEKVKKGKVRLFNEIDLAVNMVFKKYFGRFVEKVIATHSQTMYAIGYNPYLDANYYYKALAKQDATFISTDYASLDKTIPKELIKFFVYTVLSGYPNQVKEALYKTLANTFHLIEGSMYYVDCGNESGSYVTTLMNCFVVHFNTWYTCCRIYKEKHLVWPTFRELTNACNMRILGDDCIRAITGLPVTFEELKADAALMNLELTAPKQEGTLSFCSRVFGFEDGIIYPRLKEESVIGCLFYFTELTPEKIEQNMSVALFEASLHPKPFFLKVASMCDILARKFGITYDRLSYETYRLTFREYVVGLTESPVYQGQATPNSRQIFANPIASSSKEEIAIMNHKIWLNEYAQRNALAIQSEDRANDSEWVNTITIAYPGGLTLTAHGHGPTKSEAKNKSATIMFNEVSEHAPIESQTAFDGTITKPYPYAANKPATNGLKKKKTPNQQIQSILPTFAQVQQNSDTPIEPATMNQAAKFQGISSLPHSINPQPTGQVPAMTSSGEDVVAAVSSAQVQVLNPIGAPDTSTMGAIQFDIKDLIYGQFLDSDTEIEINADLPAGSIIAQIPYALANNIYTNPYIRAWGALHERYTGSFQYRFTLIGNPLFSGAVGIAWYPKRITTSTAPVSELMKYAYSAKGVTMPWNVIHTLHDARKDNFYREVADDTNLDDRPHLVLYLHMSLQNPLQPGVITRVRIASKLSNAAEPNPFRAMLPIIPSEPATTFQAASLSSPTSLQELLPGMLNLPLWIYTDGNKAVGTLPGMNRNEFQFYKADNQRGNGYEVSGGRMTNGATNVQTIAEANEDGWMVAGLPGSHVVTTLLTLHNMSQTELHEVFTELAVQGMQYKGANSAGHLTAADWADLATKPIQATSWPLVHSRTTNTTPILMETIDQGPDVNPTIIEIRVLGWHKYITSYGVLMFAITQVTQPSGTIANARKMESFSAMKMDAQLSILQIEAEVGATSPNAPELPAGYNLLQITEMPPTAVAAEGMRVPTASCNNDVVHIFARRAEGIESTQCLQFRLIDLRSSRVVATVRFLQEYGVFVINNPHLDAYRVIPQNTTDLAISLVSTVERTTDFQQTDTSFFVSRQAPSSILSAKQGVASYRTIFPKKEKVTANAALLAGGLLSGLGGALGQHAQNKQEEKMQANKFAHEEGMQSSMFDFNREMTQSQQDFQNMMQQNTFGYGFEMQEKNAATDLNFMREMQKESRETNALNAANTLTARGLGSRSFALTSSVPGSSIA